MCTCASHARTYLTTSGSCHLSTCVDFRTHACDAVYTFHVQPSPFHFASLICSVVSPSPPIVDRCIVHAYASSCVCLSHLSCCLSVRVASLVRCCFPLVHVRMMRMSLRDGGLSGAGSVIFTSQPDSFCFRYSLIRFVNFVVSSSVVRRSSGQFDLATAPPGRILLRSFHAVPLLAIAFVPVSWFCVRLVNTFRPRSNVSSLFLLGARDRRSRMTSLPTVRAGVPFPT